MSTANALSILRLKSILRYEPETGVFVSIVARGPIKVGQQVGCVNLNGYVHIQIDGVIYLGHRLAWLITHGAWPKNCVDHINGIRSDNRISNLRDGSNGVNAQNQRRPRSDNKSGFLGVSKHSDGKWQARIKIGSTYKSLGLHQTPELARDAYIKAKRQFHQGCTI
jgi:hypothetical protein